MYGYAVRTELLPYGSNPVRHVEPYRSKFSAHYLTSEEIEAVGAALVEAETVGLPWNVKVTGPKAKHLANPENQRTVVSPYAIAAIRLLLLTGARSGEILRLRWDQVDFERRVLVLPDSKTGKKTIVLNSYALLVLADIPRVGPYVIVGANPNKPRYGLQRQWSAVLRRAGVSRARIHDLRHTHASVGVGEGLGLPIVGKILGHRTALATEQYAHLELDPVRYASEKIGQKRSASLNRSRQGER
jgi:integrase